MARGHSRLNRRSVRHIGFLVAILVDRMSINLKTPRDTQRELAQLGKTMVRVALGALANPRGFNRDIHAPMAPMTSTP